MNALYAIKDKFVHLVQVSEIRMAAKDDLPMSGLKNKTCIGLHWTWWRKYNEILAVLPIIESTLAKFEVKPHYGKVHEMGGTKFEELFG